MIGKGTKAGAVRGRRGVAPCLLFLALGLAPSGAGAADGIQPPRPVRPGPPAPDAPDPSDSRLFFGPTARVPAHGKGYYGVYELVFPSAAVGLWDRFMISGGVSLLPGAALRDQIAFLSPKARLFRIEGVSAAVGTFTITSFWLSGAVTAGYGVLTVEQGAVAFTGGAAIPFVEDDDDFDAPIVLAGGEFRVSSRVKLMGEGWFAQDGNPGMGLVGVRLVFPGCSVEGAIVGADGQFLPFPLVSATIGF